MDHLLYLLADERKIFKSLPAALREGWTVEDEVITVEDTPGRREMRISLMETENPALMSLASSAFKAKKPEEILGMVRSLNLQEVSEKDIKEFCYVLGPDGISFLMKVFFTLPPSKGLLEAIAAFGFMRHLLQKTMKPTF